MSPEIFGMLILACGGWFVIHEQRTAAKMKSAVHWPFVTGEILTAKLRRKGGSKPVYRARIKYRYHVGGNAYAGKAIVFGGEVNSSRKKAEDRLGKYPEGSLQKVYYNPANPSDACLEVVHEGRIFGTVGGLAGVSLGLMLILGIFPQG